MPEDQVYIRDRAAKLRFLKMSVLARDVSGHDNSLVAFAKAIGIGRSTVNDWLNEATRRPTISTVHNSKIATRFRFPANWDAWLTKSVEVFKEEFEAHARSLLDRPLPPSQRRETDKPLKLGPDREIERGPIRGLASIELRCGQIGRGETVIGVNIACGDAIIPVSPYPITVRAGELEIDCGRARATEDSVKGASQGSSGRFDATGTHGVVRCKWSGDFARLRWILESTGSSIGTLLFERGVLATITQIAPGDVIKGTFGTYLKEIESDESGPPRSIDEITVVNRLGEQPEMPEEQLSILQKRIVEHLRKSVLQVNNQGFAVISSHELHFVESTNK